MERDVKQNLKEVNKLDYFTKERFRVIKEVMAHAMRTDSKLKGYLSISPDFKAQFVADHIVKFVDRGLID